MEKQIAQEPLETWSLGRRIAAVAAVSAGSLLYTLDGGVANVALPTIARQLGVGASSAVLLVSVYNLVLAMTLLPLAAVGDRYGHKRIFAIGFALYLVAAAGCFIAGGLVSLLMFRGLQAVAASSLLSVSLGLVRAIYPSSMLGRGMGFNTMVSSAGAALAPVLGGFIITALSWHWIFTAGAPFALAGLLTVRALPDGTRSTSPYDSIGALLCAVTFGLLISGFQVYGEGASPFAASGCIAAGILAAVCFVQHERRVALPVLPVDLLARPPLALSVAGALLAVLGSTSLLLYLPFELTGAGIAPAMIGTMIAPYAIAVMICAPLSGMLSDRVSPQLLGVLGLVLASAGTVSFVWLDPTPTYLAVAWRTALCGIGFSLFFSPNGRLMITSAPPARVAGASSLLSTTRMFGQALGSALLGGLLAMRAADGGPAMVIGGLVVAALGCAVARMVISADARRRAPA